jgi:hypothetical protein
MITINYNKTNQTNESFSIFELIQKTNDGEGKRVFLGKIAEFRGLFIISYSSIIFAEDPRVTWTEETEGGYRLVEVFEFVDIEINIKQETN